MGVNAEKKYLCSAKKMLRIFWKFVDKKFSLLYSKKTMSTQVEEIEGFREGVVRVEA